MRRRGYAYVSMVFATGLIATLVGFTTPQVASLTVFFSFIYGSLLFWRFRLAFAFMGITILLALGLIDVPHLIEFAGLDIILFLIGMMIVVGFLEERRFFEYIMDRIVVMVGPSGYKLMVVMMVMASVFAALVDEVTSILFMAAIMIRLAIHFKLNPIPFVVMLIFTTNIGSSATVVGNPIGVMIALRADLTFVDFLRWATPVSMLGLGIVVALSLLYFQKDVRMLDERIKLEVREGKEEGETMPGKEIFVPAMLFLGTITFLVLHSTIEGFLGLEKNTMLIGTALGAGASALLISGDKARELVERRVDWWTLAFFMLLFASVGALSFVGVIDRIAGAFIALPLEDVGLLATVMWTSGLLSAFMDNVLAIAVYIPIIQSLGDLGLQTFPFWWGMLFAGTFFGNLTMIGSTANIVAIGMVERRNLGEITLSYWIKPGALVSIPSLALAMLLLFLQLPFMPQ